MSSVPVRVIGKAFAASLLCSVSLLAASATAQPAPPIRFAAEVPAIPGQLQVFKLSATPAPTAFLNEKLTAGKLPALKAERGGLVARGAGGDAASQVRAFVDPKNGDATFTPSLADLVRQPARQPLAAERASGVARQAFSDTRFIPKDGTEARVVEPIGLMGGAAPHAATTAAGRVDAHQLMTMVPAERYAAGLPVYGLGSHALVSIGNDGAIVGAIRHWRTAAQGPRLQPSVSSAQVRSDIERQLRPQLGGKGATAVVDKIALAYYDANAAYLQPVVRFEATMHSTDKRIGDTKIAGYVPLIKPLERGIPDLGAKPTGAAPATPKAPTPAGKVVGQVSGPGIPGDISLGEYANQDWPTSSAYLTMANSFLNGLKFLNSIFPGITPPVARTQWYTAHNWEVVGPSSKYYMNAVNVAYTEPHGDWLINSTLSNCCEDWYVPNIGTGGNPGFGHAAGGVLATWLIMSCEVIPSMYDRQFENGGSGNPYTAFDAWWGVFQGMHNVLGFRTIMFYPDDALNWGFGYSASFGGDVNAAWFQAVAAYDGNDGTYASQHLKNAVTVHYDRASSMVDARNLGQSIYSVGAQSASSTLWNFWMGN